MHILIAYLSRRLPFYYGWLVLGSAGSSMFVRNAAGSLTFAVFVPLIADDTGWSRALIGGAAAVGGLLATGASPPVGWAIDRYGARVVLVLGLIVIGLSTMAMAWLSVHIAIFYAALAIGRIMFSSPLNVGPATVVGRWFVRQRGRATGLLFLSHSGGMVAFPLVATWVSVVWGWETAWIVLGVMVYAVALLPASLLIAQRPEDVGLLPDGDHPDDAVDAVETAAAVEEQPADAGIEWTTREALRTPALWVLALGTGFLFLLQSGTNNYQADLLRSKGIELALSQLSIVVNAAGTGIGSLLWGRVVEKDARVIHLRHRRAGDGFGLWDIRGRGHGVADLSRCGLVRGGGGRHPGGAAGGLRQFLRPAVAGNHTGRYRTVHVAGPGHWRGGVGPGVSLHGRILRYRVHHLHGVGRVDSGGAAAGQAATPPFAGGVVALGDPADN